MLLCIFSPTTRISVITHSFFCVPTLPFLLQDHPVFQIRVLNGKRRLFQPWCHVSAAVRGWLTYGRDETGRRAVPLVCEGPCLMVQVPATLGLRVCPAFYSLYNTRVSGIFGFPSAPKFILTLVAVQQLSKTICFYKEFSKRWWNAHLVIFQLLRSGSCLQKMRRYLIQAEAGNVTRPSTAPFSPQVL